MTPEELDKRFDNVIQDMQTDGFGSIMSRIGNDALVTLRTRIIETGVDHQGNKYKPYSTKPMLANCSSMTTTVCSQIAGSKEKRKDLKWVTLKHGSKNVRLFELSEGYKQFRELHGRQVDHRDFMFNGRMWGNVKLKSEAGELNSGIARIGATEDKENDILAGNTERSGPILALSNTEIKDITSSFNIQLMQLFKKHGL